MDPDSGPRNIPSDANVSSKSEEQVGPYPPVSDSVEVGTPPPTKEEQWALFEKELKENDWGHQPC